MLAGASVGCFVGAPIGHLAGHQAGQLTGRLADAGCGIAEFLLEDLERMGIDHGLAGVDFVGAKEREELADEHLYLRPVMACEALGRIGARARTAAGTRAASSSNQRQSTTQSGGAPASPAGVASLWTARKTVKALRMNMWISIN